MKKIYTFGTTTICIQWRERKQRKRRSRSGGGKDAKRVRNKGAGGRMPADKGEGERAKLIEGLPRL